MNQGRPEVVDKQVGSLGFSVFSVDEIHELSVKRLTNPTLFDNLRNATIDGLYDPALGPIDPRDSCETCRLSFLHCPGHFGHIDLALPVYNPILFPVLFKLLKGVCFSCHHFKMSVTQVEKHRLKLELISKGLLVDAMGVRTSKPSRNTKEGNDGEEALEDEEEEDLVDLLEDGEAMADVHSSVQPLVSGESPTHGALHAVAASQEVIGDFFSAMPISRCENCKAYNFTLRKDGYSKIFRAPLTDRRRAKNEANNITFPDVLKDRSLVSELSSAAAINTEVGELEGIDSQYVYKPKDDKVTEVSSYMTPSEVEEHIRLLWGNEAAICNSIWTSDDSLSSASRKKLRGSSDTHSMFFLQAILVPPNRFRPVNKIGQVMFEHPQNVFLGKILTSNIYLIMMGRDSNVSLTRSMNAWLALQNNVNCLLDSSLGTSMQKGEAVGIRQQIEKKEGLFRMNMMGKRVNHACRSVISPDPYIQVNEIGIPPYFATRLTTSVPVTEHNREWLRELVRRGPEQHPGANAIEDEGGNIISLKGLSAKKREALAKSLSSTPTVHKDRQGLSTGGHRGVTKAVYRHLMDGDMTIVNRQPTLHKPGIMAHRAKILKGEKTLRLHYANCNVYNADFDGDEMNVHFPQDFMGQAEAMAFVNADCQYIVPTSGTPSRGLIQDHIIAGTLLTVAGTVLTKSEYQQLLYAACIPNPGLRKHSSNKMCSMGWERDLQTPPPAILKPQRLWTGKQVLTAILNHLTDGQKPMSFRSQTKVSGQYWNGARDDDTVFAVKNNEILTGVLDKAQFGKWGLVHAFHELYGSSATGKLLSMLSRLLTAFLQIHGFTCGIDDLLLSPEADVDRVNILKQADSIGDREHAKFVGMEENCQDMVTVLKEVSRQIRQRKEAARAVLDNRMTSALSKVTTQTTGRCLPSGQKKPFPQNCMSLMTVTGAKGSNVNFNQIAALLGQQELEGKRVPRMASGKTLPCFAPWAPQARAGGFISNRFLTGLRPQEYYFHCMAGRDGLVDTTVKTSRSGYLQRCMVKNLEGLCVHYDYTVRDSDSTVVQFRYGSDALDSTKTSYLTNFDFMIENEEQLRTALPLQDKKNPRAVNMAAKDAEAGVECVSHTSLDQYLPGSTQGSVSEAYDQALTKRLKKVSKEQRKALRSLLETKYQTCLAEPGEPVGVLAAQSIGEPSTQMTLNTFHFAGRGEANVTLGIPRLREILMTAARKIGTPVMEVPLLPGRTRKDAETVANQLRKLSMAELLHSVQIEQKPKFSSVAGNSREFKIRVVFYEAAKYPPELGLQFEELVNTFRDQFLPRLVIAIKRAQNRADGDSGATISTQAKEKAPGAGEERGAQEEEAGVEKEVEGGGGEEEEEEEDHGGEEDGHDAEKRKGQATDERAYDDEEERNEIDQEDLEKGEDGDSGAEEEEAAGGDASLADEDELFGGDDSADAGNAPTEFGKKSRGRDAQKKEKAVQKKKVPPRKVGQVHGDIAVGPNWCEAVVSVPLSAATILLHEMVERVTARVMVRETAGIDRCLVLDGLSPGDPPRLQIEGLNFEGLAMASDSLLDMSQLRTNHIYATLNHFGVEAARATIVSEVKRVFDMYGIKVDTRHLSLIGDFMTQEGGYRPCNRMGISSNSSPLQKMSFETAMHFLVDATLHGQKDYMESPSARIVMGRIVGVGTGSFDLYQAVSVV